MNPFLPQAGCNLALLVVLDPLQLTRVHYFTLLLRLSLDVFLEKTLKMSDEDRKKDGRPPSSLLTANLSDDCRHRTTDTATHLLPTNVPIAK